MTDDYEAINNLESKQNDLLDKSIDKQQEIVNQQTQMNVDQLQRQKEKLDEEAIKTNKALYTEYKKNNNPYGANAEQLASRGLGNSGYAETTQTSLYNTYQKNVTDTLNNARSLKADFDFQISQAKQQGNITLAQNLLDIYNQKLQLLTQNYELRNNREQFLYQKQRDNVSDNQWQQTFNYQQNRDSVSDEQWNRNFDYQQNRDKVSDNQWEKQYNYQKNRDKVSDNQWNQTFNYQKQRDAVSDSQWEKEYQLSKKAKASSSSRNSSKKSSGTTSSYNIRNDDVISVSNSNSSSSENNSGSKVDTEELANRVSNIIGMAQRDVDPNKTSAKNLIDNMYNKGQLTLEEKAIVLQMIGG